MIENSSAGLVLLDAEVTVTVTREERHQRELARYTVPPGRERHVAVELGWCTIDSGKYRGQQAIEVRLDGYRVGELTYLMSQRYAPLVGQVADQGGRPGCDAVVHLGPRGLEVTLRLPRSGDAIAATVLPQSQRKPFTKRPGWIAAAAVALVLFIASLANDDDEKPPASEDTASDRTTTTTSTTTTTPPPTTTTTTVAPAPPPVVVEPQPVQTVTEEPAPPPPPPAPEPEPAPAPEPEPACDPNYSGCVPVDSDVDCAGGSGNGPSYVEGPVQVIGSDIYGLDRDGDGTACDG